MSEINPAFWAKKQDANGHEWLSLAQHSEDTRQIARLLWTHWLSEGQRRHVISCLSLPSDLKMQSVTNASEVEIAHNLVGFLGAIHDIGKATPAFQIKPGFVNSPDLDSALMDKLEGAGFSDLRHLRLADSGSSPHALAGQCLLSKYGVREDIASIVGAHHGKPVDADNSIKNQLPAYSSNYFQTDNPGDTVYQVWENEQKKIFDWALEVNEFKDLSELPEIRQSGQVLLSGLLIMADWIASNEKYFPLVSLDTSVVEDPKSRVECGFKKWSEDTSYPWNPNEGRLKTANELYEDRFGFGEPRNVQAVFAETIESCENPGIFILEAPMGLGKTEAALVAVEQLARKTGRSGMFFGLPTQATSNGIFPRIRDWLESVGMDSEDPDDKFGLRLLHGKAALNPDFDRLRSSAKNVNIDGEEHGSVTVNEWFSGRKTASLDDFIVGTVDQFLMVALKQKHLTLRHLGFSKKVIVIDEVHAYDSYMSQYLYQAVRWMGAYGVPVIILSATLPADRREELVEQYLRGAGYKIRDCIRPVEGLMADDYPLITYTDGNAIKQVYTFEPPKPEEIKNIQIFRYQDSDIISLISDLFAGGGVIGIILNTVKRAQELAIACSENFGRENVKLLHSNFIATDRIEKEVNLIRMIGKNAKRPERKIIIGTQVMEQSLDIDFDVLISDLAPMDLLIQRAGRLHRHKETMRPPQHEAPVLYVLGCSSSLEFEGGSEAVYGGYLLARTQALLPEILLIPKDISPLVQRVYRDDELAFPPEVQAKYEAMKTKHSTLLENKSLKAQTYRIDDPVLKPSRIRSSSLIGWLKNNNPNESEEIAYAQVRDTQETIEVIALQRIGEGYSFIGADEDISGRIDEPEIAKKIAQHTLRLPGVLSAPYRIDKTICELEKYNQQNLKDWQSKSWLKGSLGILFDSDGCFELNGYKLSYDKHLGLSYKEVKDE